ncbi:MAG: uridine diphosphate-N-acetylglucosamine-binding protein YvcK [Acidimicrobiia bacterium]|nr:uridine diphosphate-N-acetylglucosamine-binding protein YvcK [Acidimicrobiia bacterium]
MTTPETSLESELLQLTKDGPRVVAIGGGHGLAQALEAALSYASHVTAVVTVGDDGGSSGRLTSTLEIPPPGDIRKCLLALSPEPTVLRELFGYRFESTDVAGHSLGNLMLAALTELLGDDFEAAVRVVSGMLGTVGQVVPVAAKSLHLQAVVDGRLVDGQAAITRARGSLSELRLVPDDEPANPRAVEAVQSADQILIGPGSLFTSVIAALAVPGMAEALQSAPGHVVFVANLVTQDGETLGMTCADHLEALRRVGGVDVAGTIVAHRGDLHVKGPVEQVEVDKADLAAMGWDVVDADLVDPEADWPQHDPIRLGRVLARLKN